MNLKVKLTVIAMAIGIFLCMLDTTIMNITLPAIQTSLNVSLGDLSWALNVYTIIFAVFTIPLSRLADILGRNKVYLFGLLIFSVGSIFSGLANSATSLILSRALQSIGAAIIFPASMTIGISATDLAHRTGVVATLGVTQGLASALGPTIGGIITQYLGWRWVFFINVPLTLIALGLCLKLLTFKNEPKIQAKLDIPGMILSMIMLFTLTLALVKGSDWGWRSSNISGLFVLSALALLAFIIVERHVQQPMVPLGLFKQRQFVGAALAVMLTGIFLIAILVVLPTFFTKVQGKSELTAALMITPASAMIFLFSPISGLLIDKIGPRIMVSCGFCAMILGYIVLYLMDPAQYPQVLAACLLIGAGYGIIAGPIVVLGAADFTGELLSASQSVLGLFRQIGSVLAVAIFVSMLTTNLNTAKTSALRQANTQISALNLSATAKATFKHQVAHQIKNEDTKTTTVSTQQLIKQNYQKTIAKMGSTKLSTTTKQRIHAKVAATVKQQQPIIKRTSTEIRHNTTAKITSAFITPYRKALPFIILSGGTSFLFYRRHDYIKRKVKRA